VAHTSPASLVRAREAVERLFDKGRETKDLFVLITLGRELRVIQTATSDITAIRAKLNGKELSSAFASSQSPQLAIAVNDVRRRMDDYCSKCACGRSASNQKDVCDVERQQIRQDLEARSEQFATFTTAFFAGLKSMVDELAKIEAHRTLILVSDGFTLMPGEEMYTTAAAYLPNSPYFRFDPGRNMQSALDESLKSAVAHDIVISSIDTRGVHSPAASAGGFGDASNAGPGATGRQDVLAGHVSRGGGASASGAMMGGTVLEDLDSKWSALERGKGTVLAELAETTGGTYFHDNNNLLKGFRDVLTDNSESYVLAYVPTNTVTDG
jgi:VWFA-related protein